MARLIATIVYVLGIWQLFRLNRKAEIRTSKALWIPTVWFFIAASRPVSEWLQSPAGAANSVLEGSPLDRAIFSAILALGVIVLLGRTGRAGKLLRSNLPILLYFLYCGISVLWSDFPDVAFKRWFKGIGDVVMVLIVLTESDWVVALRQLLTRAGFVLLPVSILFIKYYPQYGRFYTHAGTPTWTGVATDKNALGMLSLLIGLASILRFLQIYRGEENARKTGPLVAQGVLIAIAIYLLWEANSATAFACFFLAGGPMVLTYLFRWARKPVFVHAMVIAALGVSFSALFLNVGTGLVEDLGRNSTLTGRTAIWHVALGMVQNPVLGTGYESFWLGPRPAKLANLVTFGVNQAHNGYIEIFLNLGWIGVALLLVVLFTAYRRVVTAVRWMTPVASLRLAYFIVAIAYNFTEAGFQMMHPVWITFLLVTMLVPEVPRTGYSPPLRLNHSDDLAEHRPEVVKSYLQSNSGRPSQCVHREELQSIRQL
jgi:exopolysaccharide production protein ExoQ